MTYSFDIFDTLIIRTVAEPTGIFVIMEYRLLHDAQYAALPLHFRKHFRDYRVNAEIEANMRAGIYGREDITLDMIYTQLAFMNHMSDEMKARLMELELATELENCEPVFENIKKLKALKQENKIYLLSDMYLPAEHIRKILVSIDGVFEEIPILVSGEMDKTKRSGSLYYFFLSEYQIDRFEWLHIGDNFASDGVMVERLNGQCELYQGYVYSDFEQRLLKDYGNEYAVQIILGAVKNAIGGIDSFAGRIGVTTGGPILYGYVLWVLQEAVRQGVHTLFFIARDGYLIKKMADIIIANQKLHLQTCYLYGSRCAWRVPAVGMNEGDFKAWVMGHMEFSTFAEFAEYLHMEQGELADYFPKVFQTEGRRLSFKEMLMIKKILLADKELLSKLFARFGILREEAAAYLRQEISSAEGKIAFVDFNGTGYTQYCMQQIIAEFYKEPVITFFYSMTGVFEVETPNNRFYKYMYEKLPINDVVELLTTAPHGQTKGYCAGEDGSWEPILDEPNKECPDEKVYTDYVNGVLEFTRHACRHRICAGEDLAGLSLMYVKHICSEPEPEVQDFIGDMPYSLDGTFAGMGTYAPKLTDLQLRQLFLHGISREECYPGVKLEFSLLRLTPEQKEKVAYYRTLNPSGQCRKEKKPYCEYSKEVAGNIVLYGAGRRGQNIFQELQANENARVVLWVDRNYATCAKREMDISNPEEIIETVYDYVLIGVKEEGLIREIRSGLVEMGVPRAKILWSFFDFEWRENDE